MLCESEDDDKKDKIDRNRSRDKNSQIIFQHDAIEYNGNDRPPNGTTYIDNNSCSYSVLKCHLFLVTICLSLVYNNIL